VFLSSRNASELNDISSSLQAQSTLINLGSVADVTNAEQLKAVIDMAGKDHGL
jgi:hypothetical protein